jgi:hypothetical protein
MIAEKLNSSAHKDVTAWANLMTADDSEHFNRFKELTRIHDANRELNFGTTFPELAKYL